MASVPTTVRVEIGLSECDQFIEAIEYLHGCINSLNCNVPTEDQGAIQGKLERVEKITMAIRKAIEQSESESA